MITNQEAWTKIIEIAKEANFYQEEVKKKENEWTILDISRDETLTCDICYKNVQRQEIHICLKTDKGKRVICATCWQELEKEKKKGEE